MNLLVTGASGFIGAAVNLAAMAIGMNVKTVIRSPDSRLDIKEGNGQAVLIKSIDAHTDWRMALTDTEVVVHCAAKVHVSNEEGINSLAEFRKLNVLGTLNLARQAAQAGVKRFIFISSIGVNGAETNILPFKPEDMPAPHSYYAISKYEAEMGLRALASDTGMEFVIIRPPLVYGLGAPGNFSLLSYWLGRGIYLPLGAIRNKRSFVALDNLVDLILRCIWHTAAANQIFLVSDGEDLSTPDLLDRMSYAMGRPTRLVRINPDVLRVCAFLVGKQGLWQSLCGSLQVDISKTCELLAWSPPISVDEGLRRAVKKEF